MSTKPDPSIRALQEHAWKEVDAIDQALAEGRIDEDTWHVAMAELIKSAYLRGGLTPYEQAGHDGDAESWEASRSIMRGALDRDGSFLDVGCASGVMMESVARWGAEKGLAIEPYGLEIVPELAALARERLARWAHRIYVGNIRTWQPPDHRFEMVLIRPEYAPPHARADLVRHTLANVLAPKGRLIVLVGTEEKDVRAAEHGMAVPGVPIGGRIEVPHPSDRSLVRRLFWINQP
jgi:SAM-dependent methyltransferase